MANHKSAQKRARQALVRRDRNTRIKSATRTVLKNCRSALDEADAGAPEAVRAAESALRKAASKGVIPKRRASRLVARLSKRLAAK